MNIRYKLCPQMRIYDQLRYNWLPNVMFCQEPNYRSEILNTDKYGLRFNSKKDSINHQSIFETETKKYNDILIGSSTAFGVGSTSDEKTISSQGKNPPFQLSFSFASAEDCHTRRILSRPKPARLLDQGRHIPLIFLTFYLPSVLLPCLVLFVFCFPSVLPCLVFFSFLGGPLLPFLFFFLEILDVFSACSSLCFNSVSAFALPLSA